MDFGRYIDVQARLFARFFRREWPYAVLGIFLYPAFLELRYGRDHEASADIVQTFEYMMLGVQFVVIFYLGRRLIGRPLMRLIERLRGGTRPPAF